jgi:hypothetical protein
MLHQLTCLMHRYVCWFFTQASVSPPACLLVPKIAKVTPAAAGCRLISVNRDAKATR